jgi:hypothetical protein
VLRHDGRPSFDRIRYRRHHSIVFLCAFDLIELNGNDLRREPLEVRRPQSAKRQDRLGGGRPFHRLAQVEPSSFLGAGER